MAEVFGSGEWEALHTYFGGDFAEKVKTGLAVYGQRWALRELRFIPYYSVNCLFTAYSATYGDVVLKLGRPCREMFTECSALREYSGRRFCRLYEAEPENGVLLLERLLPGTPLRAVPKQEDRLRAFCGVFEGLHRAPQQDIRYPTYGEWVENIACTMRRLPGSLVLSRAMQQAETLCRSLWGRYTRRLLLHGDLHHDNILQCEGGYRIIDPKGVIGDPLFDLPRFLLNEPYRDAARPVDFLQAALETLAARLDYPAADIARCFFVDMAMSRCWSVEDGALPEEYPALEAEVNLAAALLSRYERE